jgi:hypothetical protein
MRNMTTPLSHRASTLLRRLLADRRGFSAVLTGLMLTMLVGFVGLAVDVGMWQWTQRDMQEAADHAAYAAAQSSVELNPGFLGVSNEGTSTDYTINVSATPNGVSTSFQTGFSVAVAGLGLNPANFAQAAPPPQAPNTGQCYDSQLAAQQGYTTANNVIQICVIYGTMTGQVNAYAWQVTISQPRPMWFSKILFSTASTINVSAIAEPKADNPRSCLIATSPTQSATGLAIDGTSGTANVALTNCDTLVSSSYTQAFETSNATNFSSRAVYVGGGEINGGLSFTPGPGAAQNYQNMASLTPAPSFLGNAGNPNGGDPYYVLNESPKFAPPYYTGAPSGTAPGTPNPTGGKLGNGCDFYVGDVQCPPTAAPGSCTAIPQPWYTNISPTVDGPGVYCDNPQNPNPPWIAGGSPLPLIPQDGATFAMGWYVLYGVGLQLPSSNATMSYTCENSGDSYSATTGTCNNAQGKPQIDSASGQCSGGNGGVNATTGVMIYVMPRTYNPGTGTITVNTGQVQLTPYGGTGTTCFAINAPQSTQIGTQHLLSCTQIWTAPTNFSSNYSGVSDCTLAGDIEGLAIWVASSMSNSVSDTIGPNASIAMNGSFYDPARMVYVGANSSGVAGTNLTTLVGTGSTLNANGSAPYANGATNCSQVVASQVSVKGPANVDLAYCVYEVGATILTYLRTTDYNYLGSVELVQ